MSVTNEELLQKKCLPCEGGVDACSLQEARSLRLDEIVFTQSAYRMSRQFDS